MPIFQARRRRRAPIGPAALQDPPAPLCITAGKTATLLQALNPCSSSSLADDSPLERFLACPMTWALAYVVVCGIGFMLPAITRCAHAFGWITPASRSAAVSFWATSSPARGYPGRWFALQFSWVFVIF